MRVAGAVLGTAAAVAMAAALTGSAVAAAGHGMMSEAKVTFLSPKAGDVVTRSGWDVEIQVVAPTSAMLMVKSSFMSAMGTDMMGGPSRAFPGLVVTDSATSTKFGGPMANIANLFQVIGVRHDAKGDLVVDADWFVQPGELAMAAMPSIRAFVVSGTAPATVMKMPMANGAGGMWAGHTVLSNVAAVGVTEHSTSTASM